MARKRGPTHRRSKDEFDSVLLEMLNQKVLDGVNQLVGLLSSLDGFESMGKGETSPTLYLNLRTKGSGLVYWPFLVNARTKKFIVRIRKLRKHPAFEDVSVQEDLLDRVSAALGVALEGNTSYDRWASLDRLADPARVKALGDVLAWVKSTADAESPGAHDAG